ncbi:hypothetical protein [Phenylobacterium sp.]|uniref:hypothetical protein n=1 Tax=Phenylobacterium sp. TaxID=1871053 RepID=UPI00273358D6|nr:hypothetical protein [Phenylobacterium sp.]MDP3855330.1 hypothetical protein [Phenylobacterium sp.]
MAITTIDGMMAGGRPASYVYKGPPPISTIIAGRHQSLWGLDGSPGSGLFDTTLNGVVLDSSAGNVQGMISRSDPVSGEARLARTVVRSSVGGLVLVCDRLWHNGGVNPAITTAQAIATPVWPARDMDGATLGRGVIVGLEVSAITGAGSPVVSISYTNTASVAARTGTLVHGTTSAAVPGAFYPFGLQADDEGVKSVESITLSTSWTSGTINLAAYRVLAAIDVPAVGSIDPLTGGLPRIFDGSVLFLMLLPNSSTAFRLMALLTETHG